jgi:hypothetical protein
LVLIVLPLSTSLAMFIIVAFIQIKIDFNL